MKKFRWCKELLQGTRYKETKDSYFQHHIQQQQINFTGKKKAITTLVESGKLKHVLYPPLPNGSLIGAIDHMIGNFNLFTTFQPQPSTSTIIP